MPRLQAEGWSLVAAEPTDPEVTEPTPLGDVHVPTLNPVAVVRSMVAVEGPGDVDSFRVAAEAMTVEAEVALPARAEPPASAPTARGRRRGAR